MTAAPPLTQRMRCLHCSEPTTLDATHCIRCGGDQFEEIVDKPRREWLGWLALALLAAVTVAIYLVRQ